MVNLYLGRPRETADRRSDFMAFSCSSYSSAGALNICKAKIFLLRQRTCARETFFRSSRPFHYIFAYYKSNHKVTVANVWEWGYRSRSVWGQNNDLLQCFQTLIRISLCSDSRIWHFFPLKSVEENTYKLLQAMIIMDSGSHFTKNKREYACKK